MSSSSSSPHENETNTDDLALQLKPIPGEHGWSWIGPMRDRLNYFYLQGMEEFFKTKIKKYKSTVIRTNMPPGPFISNNHQVIAVLDAASYQVLFDNTKVEKRNVLDGTFMPSLSFTGGYRVCAQLDTSEAEHASLKSFFMSFLASKHDSVIPLFRTSVSKLFSDVENKMALSEKANFNHANDVASFDFVFRLFCDGKDPEKTKLGSKGPTHATKWLFFQLCPIGSLGSLPMLLNFLEDIILHMFRMPFFLVKSDYMKLYESFYDSGVSFLDKAESLGFTREEACHNLVFLACFNAYGGFKILFPTIIKWVGLAGEQFHQKLTNEIRTIVEQEGGVTLKALEKMTLVESAIYEALRIEPPVPFQYGKAREDMVVKSHEAAFKIEKGEMVFGYMPFATKDARVFDRAEQFVGDRFLGDQGKKLLKYIIWSNGPNTTGPTPENKQCAGKDIVLLLCRVLLVDLFLRYDTFKVDSSTFFMCPYVTITSLAKTKKVASF